MGPLPGHSKSTKDMHICAEEPVTLNHRTSRTSSSCVKRPLDMQEEEISEEEEGAQWTILILLILYPLTFVRNTRNRVLFHGTIERAILAGSSGSFQVETVR